jgi:RNA 2',3'-cyclic 3'-phosphodiesterase
LRLFFVVWPDEDAVAQFSRVADHLVLVPNGRLVAPKNYHVTLAFLGEVPDAQFELWERTGAALHATRCTIAFNALEYWPKRQVVVATAQELPPALFKIWTQLQQAAGLRPVSFRAHVTLARKVAQAPVLQAMSVVHWQISNITLVRSATGGAESAYTVVSTWPLLYET